MFFFSFHNIKGCNGGDGYHYNCIMMMWRMLLVLVWMGCFIDGVKQSPTTSSSWNANNDVWILDVDNCLYCERELVKGIESQIISNTHEFGKRHFHLNPKQCDELYRSHGSSIEGFRSILRRRQDNHNNNKNNNIDLDEKEYFMLKQYYQQVYNPIDMSSLLLQHYQKYNNHPTTKILEDTKDESSSSTTTTSVTTGYSHEKKQQRRNLHKLIKACQKHHEKIFI